MINSIQELRETLAKSNTISKEITDTLVEFNNIGSMTSLADLNTMLIDLYTRIHNKEAVVFEVNNNSEMTEAKFIDWIENNFTEYTVKNFKKTIVERVN